MKVKHLSSGRCLFLTGSDYFGHYGWSGILRGAGVVFFAFIGFDAVSTAAQEAKNPQKGCQLVF
jgi:APA family basic amino acid/polyamine antiporter